MAEERISFQEVVKYAEMRGCPHREGVSKAADFTQTYFFHHWKSVPIMVLYEAPKRIVGNRTEPEVCWWVIGPDGDLFNVPSRNLRQMDRRPGFGLTERGFTKVMKTLNNIEEDYENV